jgi:RNA polymerase sigma factor (sigma-70 family)
LNKVLENITPIILGCINKDYKCQKLVYENFRGYSLKIVFRYIYRYEKAIDVMNDGFVKLFNSFHKFTPGTTEEDSEKMLMGWIKRIMINTAIDELRRGSLAPEIGAIPDHIWEIPSGENADQLLLYKDIVIMIKKLPPQYRMIFNLFVIDGYSHLEIADMLDIPVGTSKSGLSRARSILQVNIKNIESAII